MSPGPALLGFAVMCISRGLLHANALHGCAALSSTHADIKTVLLCAVAFYSRQLLVSCSC